jgi:hypothetical protein
VTLVQVYNDFLRIAKENTWGAGSAGVNEQQLLTLTGATGGTFTVTFGAGTTPPQPWNVKSDVLQQALEALATIGQGNIIAKGNDGGPYTFTFLAALGGQNVAALTADATLLTGSTPTAVVTTLVPGVAGNAYYGLRARPWSLRNVLTRAVPDGERVGSRDLDSQPSVPGRRYAQGDIPTYSRMDTLGLLLLGALGSETVAAYPALAPVRKRHQIRCANRPPSFVIQNFMGAVEAGVDKAYENKGCRVNRFTLTWDTTNDTHLLDFTYNIIGLKGARVPKGEFQASDWKALPSWNAVINRNGVAAARVQELTATFENGVARVKSGVGSQDDQDQQIGGRSFRGTLTLIYDDETEYDLFEANGDEDVEIIWTDTTLIENIAGTDYYGQLRMWIPKFNYFEYGREERDGYYIQRIGFRAYRDETIGGPVAFDVMNAQPAY